LTQKQRFAPVIKLKRSEQTSRAGNGKSYDLIIFIFNLFALSIFLNLARLGEIETTAAAQV